MNNSENSAPRSSRASKGRCNFADLIDRPEAKREDDGTSVCGHCGFRFDVSVNVTG